MHRMISQGNDLEEFQKSEGPHSFCAMSPGCSEILVVNTIL